MAEPRSLELKLESKVDSVDAAEIIVQSLARDAGYAEDEIDHLGMAVRESMVNAVTHGNSYSADKSIHFSVDLEAGGKLTVGVRDEGAGFEPESVPDPTAPENLLKSSGRGLLLMRALVDEFTVRRAEPHGMQLTMVKYGPGGDKEKEK